MYLIKVRFICSYVSLNMCMDQGLVNVILPYPRKIVSYCFRSGILSDFIWRILRLLFKSSKSRDKGLGQPLDQMPEIKSRREVISTLQIESDSLSIL